MSISFRAMAFPRSDFTVDGLRTSGLIGSNVGTGLDSTKHGRNVLLDAYQVLPAEQDCRSAALSGLHHQDIVEVYQNLSCRRSRSFQCDENGQFGLPWWLALPRAGCDRTHIANGSRRKAIGAEKLDG